MIVLDTSGTLAWLDGSQRDHGAVSQALAEEEGPFLLSPFVLAELDYLLQTRVGTAAQRLVLGEVASGRLRLEPFTGSDVDAALAVIERFSDQEIGLADASIVVLAERHRTRRVLTLDRRHFAVLRDRRGRGFELVPG